MVVEMSSCCGFNLKHRIIVIGVVQSIFAFMFLVLAAAYAENPQELIDMSDSSIVPDLTVLKIVLIVIAAGSALQCISSILLIFAAETNRPNLLFPWLILNPFTLCVFMIATLIAVIHHTGSNNTIFIIGHLLFGLFITLIVCFKILCVWNFYKYLKSLNF